MSFHLCCIFIFLVNVFSFDLHSFLLQRVVRVRTCLWAFMDFRGLSLLCFDFLLC